MADAVKLAQLRCPTCHGSAQISYREVRPWTRVDAVARVPMRFSCGSSCPRPDDQLLRHLIEAFVSRPPREGKSQSLGHPS